MLKNELIKIVSNRLFLIFFAVMVLCNGLYLYASTTLRTDQNASLASEYRELMNELSGMTTEQIFKVTSARQKEMETEAIEYIQEHGLAKPHEYYGVEHMYQEVAKEAETILRYREIVEGIVQRADAQLAHVGEEDGGYAVSVMKKTREVYVRLINVRPVYYPSRGFRAFADNPVTDCCTLFTMLLCVFLIVTAERQNASILLSKSTYRGKRTHGAVKLAALGIVAVGVTAVMTVGSICVIGCVYPFSGFRAPIQSVLPYCPLKINMGQFMCLYAGIKLIFYLFCISAAYFIACLFRNIIPVFVALACGTGVLTALYLGITETSYLAPLRTMNPIAFGQVSKLLYRYQCVNLFGFAANRVVFGICVLCMLALFFGMAAVFVYAEIEERESIVNRYSFLDRNRKWNVSITRHEWYKTLIAQKVLLILILAGAAAYMLYASVETWRYPSGRIYYDRYADEAAGPYTEEIPKYIEQNQRAVMEQLNRGDLEEGERIAYKGMLSALSQMSEYASYLSAHENSYFINNLGYLGLTGWDEGIQRRNREWACVLFPFAAVCFILTMSIDRQSGEYRLIRATEGGRRRYLKTKLGIGGLIAALLFVMFWIPPLISTLSANGTDFIFAPAYSLQHLERVPGFVSIFAYLILLYLCRYLMLLGLMLVSYLIEWKVKSSAAAIVIVCAAIEIPLAISLTW